ncbi:MAG: hypothetical protein ACNS60_18970 [Candidatus Cyclobacteriaceae bacterium M2_1C_046]
MITREIQDYKLKISSKKLKSGKCQIKFEFVQADVPSFYGYILAEGKTPLREVITTIYERTKSICVGDYFHDHLYHIQERKSPQHHLFLFKN